MATKAPLRPLNAVEKKVYFYQVRLDGETVTNARRFNFQDIVAIVGALPYTEDGRYLSEDPTAVYSCFVDAPREIRFGRIRRSNLPSIVDGAQMSDIPVAPGGGIFECSHVVYFDHGIIGADFNFYAPRIGRLADYLISKGRAPEGLEILAISRRNALELFQSFDIVKAFEIKVATQEAARLRRARTGLIASMVEAAREAGVATFDVVLASEQGRFNESLPAQLIRYIRNLLSMDNLRESIIKAAASGYHQNATRLDTIDLLAEDLVATKTFIRESARGKVLVKEQAFETIAEAFREVRPDRFLSGD